MDESTKKAKAELKVSPLAHELARVAMDTLSANMIEPLFSHMAVVERREERVEELAEESWNSERSEG